jgi:hypothetical protein
MFHHDGERAVAPAARQAGIPCGLSTLATVSVEEIATAKDTRMDTLAEELRMTMGLCGAVTWPSFDRHFIRRR